jgi:membrane-associated phospholipid phosphatase
MNRNQNFLSAIDVITLIFCSWILAYMSIGLSRAPEAIKHLPVYLGVAVGVLILAWLERVIGLPNSDLAKTAKPSKTATSGRLGNSEIAHPLGKALAFLRGIYPVLLFGYFYTSGHIFNRIIFRDWLDPWFMRIDYSIFGYYPSLEWGKTFSNWIIHEVFHLAYFCYYPMILGLPVYLYFKQPKAFKELIFNLTFVFYLCYTIYSVLPVIGGRYIPEAMELTKTYHAGPFTHLMVFIYRTSNHLGGAFPSSHIAVTLVLTVAALRFVRPLGYLFSVIAFFLSLATVFCHYHWFVDAVAGIATGIAGYYLANYVRCRLLNAGFN